MKLKDTINTKRAMLQVVEELVDSVENSKTWCKNSLDEAQMRLDEYKEEHKEDEVDSYSYKSSVQYYTTDIETYKAKLNAYETVIKALEKLI